MSNLRPLPQEIWQHIFGYLTVRELKTALRVCRNWCDVIVGTTKLINRLQIRMTREITLDHRAAGIRFILARQVYLNKIEILSVEHWWPALGASLTDLTLYECQVAVSTLLTMLRQAPNLARLALDNVLYLEMENAAEADFQLNQLEHLSLCMTFAPRIVDILRPACPALKSFMFSPMESVPFEREVIEMVQGVQGTLVELKVPLKGMVGSAVLAMERLKLRTVRVYNEEPEIVLELCRKHPELQILDVVLVPLDNSHLQLIGKLLPNLRKFTTNWIRKLQEPEIFAAMPNLEHVNISIPQNQILLIPSLGNARCRKLKSLELSWLVLYEENGWQLLNRSRNIETLALRDCQFPKWSSLVDGLNELRSMKLLILKSIMVINWTDSVNWVVNESVQTLQLVDLKIPKDQLMQLLAAFPKLVELKLYSILWTMDDSVLLEFPRLFPCLRKLLIVECPYKEDTIRQVCRELPSLQVRKLKLVSYMGKQLTLQKYALTGRKMGWCHYIMVKLFGY